MLNLNNWVNDWSGSGAQTAWHYNAINHQRNQNKWVKSSCHSSSQHWNLRIYQTSFNHTDQSAMMVHCFHFSPFWRVGETGCADGAKTLGGFNCGCHFFSPLKPETFHPRRKKIFTFSSTAEVCKLAWGQRRPFRNAQNAKKLFYLTELGKKAGNFPPP